MPRRQDPPSVLRLKPSIDSGYLADSSASRSTSTVTYPEATKEPLRSTSRSTRASSVSRSTLLGLPNEDRARRSRAPSPSPGRDTDYQSVCTSSPDTVLFDPGDTYSPRDYRFRAKDTIRNPLREAPIYRARDPQQLMAPKKIDKGKAKTKVVPPPKRSTRASSRARTEDEDDSDNAGEGPSSRPSKKTAGTTKKVKVPKRVSLEEDEYDSDIIVVADPKKPKTPKTPKKVTVKDSKDTGILTPPSTKRNHSVTTKPKSPGRTPAEQAPLDLDVAIGEAYADFCETAFAVRRSRSPKRRKQLFEAWERYQKLAIKKQAESKEHLKELELWWDRYYNRGGNGTVPKNEMPVFDDEEEEGWWLEWEEVGVDLFFRPWNFFRLKPVFLFVVACGLFSLLVYSKETKEDPNLFGETKAPGLVRDNGVGSAKLARYHGSGATPALVYHPSPEEATIQISKSDEMRAGLDDTSSITVTLKETDTRWDTETWTEGVTERITETQTKTETETEVQEPQTKTETKILTVVEKERIATEPDRLLTLQDIGDEAAIEALIPLIREEVQRWHLQEGADDAFYEMWAETAWAEKKPPLGKAFPKVEQACLDAKYQAREKMEALERPVSKDEDVEGECSWSTLTDWNYVTEDLVSAKNKALEKAKLKEKRSKYRLVDLGRAWRDLELAFY